MPKLIHPQTEGVPPSYAYYQETLVITPVAAGIALGNKPQTTYNQLANKCFLLPVVQVGRRKMVRVTDLYDYVNNLPPISAQALPKKIGRPKKINRFENAAQVKSSNKIFDTIKSESPRRGRGRPSSVSKK